MWNLNRNVIFANPSFLIHNELNLMLKFQLWSAISMSSTCMKLLSYGKSSTIIRMKVLEIYSFTDCLLEQIGIKKFSYEDTTRYKSCKLTDVKKFRVMTAIASCNYCNYLNKINSYLFLCDQTFLNGPV
jgi:hypothetical protein